MVKYEYDVEIEGFRREDHRGNILRLNITEARRVESLLRLGYSVESIYNKMEFSSGKVSLSTCRTFINNLKKGDINLEGDYPAPLELVEEFDGEAKYNELESRIKSLEDRFSEIKSDCFCTCFANEKPKNWKNLWGRV